MLTNKDEPEDTAATIVYQDYVRQSSKLAETFNPSDVFFELANMSYVGYRIEPEKIIIVKQHNDCKSHTGGIVWETSYLLASYLRHNYQNSARSLGRIIDLGAGCGLLGLTLAASGLGSKVISRQASPIRQTRVCAVSSRTTRRSFPTGRSHRNAGGPRHHSERERAKKHGRQ